MFLNDIPITTSSEEEPARCPYISVNVAPEYKFYFFSEQCRVAVQTFQKYLFGRKFTHLHIDENSLILRHEFSTEKGCILFGQQLIIPPVYQQKLLEDHSHEHPDILSWKALAHSNSTPCMWIACYEGFHYFVSGNVRMYFAQETCSGSEICFEN